MKQNEIQYLIDLYLNGETSPEQERQLAIALEQDDIPEDWQAVRLMLGELTLGEAIYDEVLAKRYRRPLWFWRWAAAAVVILAAGLGFIFHQRESTPQPVMLAESPVCRPLYERPQESTSTVVGARRKADVRTFEHRRKGAVAKPTTDDSPTLLAQAEIPAAEPTPVPDETIALLSTPSPPPANAEFAILAQEIQSIRRRGERLQNMIDAMINNEP